MSSHLRLGAIFITLGVGAVCFGAAAETGSGDALRAAVDVAVAKVKPSLVRIHVVSTSYRDGRELKFQASGSGAIITPEGHVITNHHVAGKATRIVCTLATREEVEAELIGTDALADIAVIKLIPRDGETFPVAAFGDSTGVRVGDQVMAMGSPLALSQSVTLGIVSNTEMVMPRSMGFGDFELDGEDVGSLVRWFAHDARIYGGNSGGPLVNTDGEIIGINEISFGLSGAIPGNLAKQVAEQIMKKASVSRSWTGINVQPLLKHGDRARGVLVTGVLDESPADAAGIESGDVILAVNGRDVTVRFDEQLPEFNGLIADLPIGEKVEFRLARDGEEKTVSLRTVERERRLPDERELKQWGITVRDISYVMAKEMKRESRDGVTVTSVRPGGPAGDAKPTINRGDVITAVGDEAIANVTDLVRATRALTKDATEPVPVLTTFERKAGSYVTVVKVGLRELQDPGLEVKKAWLPVQTQVITRDIAEQMGDTDLKGFRVTQVYGEETEPGLHVGDLIVAVDGELLTASRPEHYEELPTIIRSYRAGAVVELTVVRAGDSMQVPVALKRSPKLDREMKKFRDDNFEYTVRNVTFFDKADERWRDDHEGVLVEEVVSGGWAALGQLHIGDLIVAVDGEPIADVEAIARTMKAIEARTPRAVVFKVLRGIYTVYVELEPKWD